MAEKRRLKGKDDRLEYIVETNENQGNVWVVVLILSRNYIVKSVNGLTTTIGPGWFVLSEVNGSSKFDFITSKRSSSSLSAFLLL